MKIIKTFPEYTITEDGVITRIKSGRVIKHQVNIDGYFVVNLIKDGKPYHRRVCRLKAEAFLNDFSDSKVVNHKDLNKQNDALENLEMVSTLENNLHSIRLQPDKHKARATITKQVAVRICEMFVSGATNEEVSKELGISKDITSKVRNRCAWRDVSDNYDLPKCPTNYSPCVIRKICVLIADGVKPTKIFNRLASEGITVTLDLIKDIKRKRNSKVISDEYFKVAPSTTRAQARTLK